MSFVGALLRSGSCCFDTLAKLLIVVLTVFLFLYSLESFADEDVLSYDHCDAHKDKEIESCPVDPFRVPGISKKDTYHTTVKGAKEARIIVRPACVASKAIITPNAAIRRRRAEATDNRVPMSALNTYREGNVTARVRKKASAL